MVSSRRQRHEKASRFKRKTVGSFQFWRRPGSDDARGTAKIWSGTHARYDPAGHRAAAKQTHGLINRRGRCGGPDPSGNDHRQETGLQRIAFLWRSHRVCLGGSSGNREKYFSEGRFLFAVSLVAPSKPSIGSRPTKRKLSTDSPKPQSLLRLTVWNSIGPGSSFSRRMAPSPEACRRE